MYQLKSGLVLLLLGSSIGVAASEFSDAINEGEGNINFRYRYETVSQDGLKDADASTLRTRVNFKSGTFDDFQFMIEIDNVYAPFVDDYNSTSNGKTDYAVVADPEGTDLNQLWLSYQGVEDTTLSLGRQRIIFDNARFIGNVGWRQNEQTYDSFKVENRSIENSVLTYSYVYEVNRIFDPDNSATGVEHDSHLLNYQYQGWSFANLAVYSYLVDNQEIAAGSSSTYGVRLVSKAKKGFGYEVEFAKQSDYDDNPNSVSADYSHLKASYAIDYGRWYIGLETLSGDGPAGSSFQTPLATLHKFNGFADKFLNTPGSGLEDLYFGFSTLWEGYNFNVTWHDYSPDASGSDYGTELNFVVSKKLSDSHSILLKYADYDADNWATDTTKVMLMLTANY